MLTWRGIASRFRGQKNENAPYQMIDFTGVTDGNPYSKKANAASAARGKK